MRLIELVARSLGKKVEDLDSADIVNSADMFVCANTNFDDPEEDESELLVWLSRDNKDQKNYSTDYGGD